MSKPKTPMASLLPAVSEREVVKACVDYLAIRGIFAYRNNTGTSGPMFYKGKRRFVKFGAAGAPDIVCVIGGRYIGVEVKRPSGGRLSEAQRAFHANLRAAGGIVFVVRGVAELANALDQLD